MDNQLFFKSQQYQLRLNEVTVMRYHISGPEQRNHQCYYHSSHGMKYPIILLMHELFTLN